MSPTPPVECLSAVVAAVQVLPQPLLLLTDSRTPQNGKYGLFDLMLAIIDRQQSVDKATADRLQAGAVIAHGKCLSGIELDPIIGILEDICKERRCRRLPRFKAALQRFWWSITCL